MPDDDPDERNRDAPPGEYRKITDARTLRALAHPVRLALIEALAEGGPQTATEAGERIGESPTTCSFHLRQLARYGFVEEAGGGTGRSRPWRLSTIGMSLDPDPGDRQAQVASEAVLRLFRDRQLARYESWRATWRSYPEPWQDAASDSEYLLFLTAAELTEMKSELLAVLDRWFARDGRFERPERRPAGSVPVETLLFAYPLAPPAEQQPAEQQPTHAGEDGA